VPDLCGVYPGICLTTEEKALKNLRYESECSLESETTTNYKFEAYIYHKHYEIQKNNNIFIN
jgi:hypothetical protein